MRFLLKFFHECFWSISRKFPFVYLFEFLFWFFQKFLKRFLTWSVISKNFSRNSFGILRRIFSAIPTMFLCFFKVISIERSTRKSSMSFFRDYYKKYSRIPLAVLQWYHLKIPWILLLHSVHQTHYHILSYLLEFADQFLFGYRNEFLTPWDIPNSYFWNFFMNFF